MVLVVEDTPSIIAENGGFFWTRNANHGGIVTLLLCLSEKLSEEMIDEGEIIIHC